MQLKWDKKSAPLRALFLLVKLPTPINLRRGTLEATGSCLARHT
jgi:hypothetical protein